MTKWMVKDLDHLAAAPYNTCFFTPAVCSRVVFVNKNLKSDRRGSTLG